MFNHLLCIVISVQGKFMIKSTRTITWSFRVNNSLSKQARCFYLDQHEHPTNHNKSDAMLQKCTGKWHVLLAAVKCIYFKKHLSLYWTPNKWAQRKYIINWIRNSTNTWNAPSRGEGTKTGVRNVQTINRHMTVVERTGKTDRWQLRKASDLNQEESLFQNKTGSTETKPNFCVKNVFFTTWQMKETKKKLSSWQRWSS